VERNKLLKLIITTEPKYTEPVGDTFTIPAAQYTINFKSYNDYKKEIHSQLIINKEAKAKEIARASGKTSDELKAEYKKASLEARDAFNTLKNKELRYYINQDNPSNSVPTS
jgi:polyribonucleotide nucleotidyltransferase